MFSTDEVLLLSMSLAVVAFLVTNGALELMTLILVPASVAAVLTMKAYFPPELLMLAAGAALVACLMRFKNMGWVGFGLIIVVVAGAVLILKMFLPVVVLTRLAMSIIFLGLMKILIF